MGVEQLEDEVARVRGEIMDARKELKKFSKGLGREWWRGMIQECEEASAWGRIGDMYKCLRRLGGERDAGCEEYGTVSG